MDSSEQAATLNTAGNANPNGQFRYDASLGGYLFNLSTKGLAAGTYTLYFLAGKDPTSHALTFGVTLRPVFPDGSGIDILATS